MDRWNRMVGRFGSCLNPMIHCHWFLRDKIVDSVSYTREDIHPSFNPQMIIGVVNVAHFCPRCGEVWSRLYHDISEEPNCKTQWKAQHKLCDKCGGGELLSEFHYCLPEEKLHTQLPAEFLRFNFSHRKPGVYHV